MIDFVSRLALLICLLAIWHAVFQQFVVPAIRYIDPSEKCEIGEPTGADQQEVENAVQGVEGDQA